ncbi:hypothetical protein [Methanobacterium sp.]|uniref:hypothetical protein n=1 Tax=Methanobacterium sp. TaxID=2164 RepID=UPI003C706A8B
MRYLICKKCGNYYKLKKDELPGSFSYCNCNGELKYYDSLEDYFGEVKSQKLEILDTQEEGIFLQNPKISKNQIEDLLLVNNLLKIDKEEDKIKME